MMADAAQKLLTCRVFFYLLFISILSLSSIKILLCILTKLITETKTKSDIYYAVTDLLVRMESIESFGQFSIIKQYK